MPQPSTTAFRIMLMNKELDIYTCVLLARKKLDAGNPISDVLATLRVDADKIRSHDEDLYQMIQ